MSRRAAQLASCVRVTAVIAFAWLCRSRRPASPPDASALAGRSVASRPRTSSSRGPGSFASVAATAARPSRLRFLALAAALLALPLPGAFAPAALAQSLPTLFVAAPVNVGETSGSGDVCVVKVSSGTTQSSPLTVNMRISQTGDFLAPGETGDKTLVKNPGALGIYSVNFVDDDVDKPDGTLTCTLLPGDGYAIHSTLGSHTARIIDDDPTIVTLARVGSGAVSEGGRAEFEVRLGRELVAGEIVEVPLVYSEDRTNRSDRRIFRRTGPGFNTGVRLINPVGEHETVRFAGAGARVARLVLMPLHDGRTEGTVTYTVELGRDISVGFGFDHPNRHTNVGGGADPHPTLRSISVAVNDVAAPARCKTGLTERFPGCVWITGGRQVREGGDVTFTVHAAPPPPEDLDVTFAVFDAVGLNDYLRGSDDGRVTLTIPKGQSSATWTVRTVNDGANEEHGEVRAEMRYGALHPGGPDRKIANEADFYYGTRNPRVAWVKVLDNDPRPREHIPPEISIEVLPVSGRAAKGGYASFCTTVDGFVEHAAPAHQPGWFHVHVEVRTSEGVWVRGSAQKFNTGDTERLCSRIDTTPWAGQTLIARVLPAPRLVHLNRWIRPYVPGASPTATLTVGASPAGLSFATKSRMVPEGMLDPVKATEAVYDPDGTYKGVRFRTVNNRLNLGVDIVPPATGAFDLAFEVGGTATPGVDYIIPGVTGSSGTVAVPAGARRVYIPVEIIDDTIEDNGETIVVRLPGERRV